MLENYLIYDGECPFCSRYAHLTRLRDTVGALRLVNARTDAIEVREAIAAGYRLDEGMLLSIDGQYYYGADCLNRLALLSSRSSIFNRITYWLFQRPRLARLAYPVLRSGRNVALRMLSREPLAY